MSDTLLVALLLTAGCGRAAPPSLDDDARQYVRLAVALGERDPDALDFYVGPPGLVADVRRAPPPLTVIKHDAHALASRVRENPADGERVTALAADLAAIVARVDALTGARVPYDAESAAWFGVVPGPTDGRRLDEIRSQIGGVVGGAGRLVDRYAAFSSRFTIPRERLEPVMAAALDACRTATLAHVALPAGESARLEFVSDKPWAASSRYLGGGHSVIWINTDFRFTVDQALQVACHEGYPGHHARNTLTGPSPGPAPVRPERSVQLTFSPESLRSEASAMLAADIAFPPDERLAIERASLFPAAGLPADAAAAHIEVERLVGELQIVQADVARRYLDGELEFARAVRTLEDAALVPHAEALVKYINEYRSYITTYTTGRQILAARLATCTGTAPSDDVRWRCYVAETIP